MLIFLEVDKMGEPLKYKKYIPPFHTESSYKEEDVKSAVEYREYLLNKQLDELAKIHKIEINRKPFELTKDQAFPDFKKIVRKKSEKKTK